MHLCVVGMAGRKSAYERQVASASAAVKIDSVGIAPVGAKVPSQDFFSARTLAVIPSWQTHIPSS